MSLNSPAGAGLPSAGNHGPEDGTQAGHSPRRRCGYFLLNATYAGNVRHRGVIYPGEHPAIIEPVFWEEVNREFSKQEKPQPGPDRNPQNAALAGLLICKNCQQPMIATYTNKGSRRYHYYVCQTARQKGWKSCPTKSVAAGLLEASIVTQLRARLNNAATSSAGTVSDSQALHQGDPGIIPTVIDEVRYDGTTATVMVKLKTSPESAGTDQSLTFEYKIPGRRGRALPAFRLQPSNETFSRPPRLARLVALAHKLEALVRSDQVKDYSELARLARVSPARIGQIVILAQLAPTIQEQVLFLSTEQSGVIGERALREIAREPRWDRQRASFEQLITAHP